MSAIIDAARDIAENLNALAASVWDPSAASAWDPSAEGKAVLRKGTGSVLSPDKGNHCICTPSCGGAAAALGWGAPRSMDHEAPLPSRSNCRYMMIKYSMWALRAMAGIRMDPFRAHWRSAEVSRLGPRGNLGKLEGPRP